MHKSRQPGGSATRWGPLFGGRARDWAETWEGPRGWGTPVYEHVLDRANIGSGTRVLDCGCGAGRFAQMAADRGASVAGIDAARELIEIAAERTPEGDFRVGDLEALPWPEDSFDMVTGFSTFQFADDKPLPGGRLRDTDPYRCRDRGHLGGPHAQKRYERSPTGRRGPRSAADLRSGGGPQVGMGGASPT
jgi:SAM-dependent methyltransferase